MKNHQVLSKGLLAALLMSGASNLFAAMTSFNYTITGTVLVGEESYGTGSNDFGLSENDVITASGSFTAESDLLSSGGTVQVDTMTINLNGTLLTAADADYMPFLSFNYLGQLVDFDYEKSSAPTFNSSFTFFDDFKGMDSMLFGEWNSNAVVEAAPVPEPETYAMMLAGLGLVGYVATKRRKQ